MATFYEFELAANICSVKLSNYKIATRFSQNYNFNNK